MRSTASSAIARTCPDSGFARSRDGRDRGVCEMSDATESAARFCQDGVVLLRGALDAESLDLSEQAYQWSVHNPGPHAATYDTPEGVFWQDVCNPCAPDRYETLLASSAIARLGTSLWGVPDIWFMFEQVFLKEGGTTRRTPWHQDSSYMTVRGDHQAVLWIALDKVSKQCALEFIPGSHRGPTYNGSTFELADDTAPRFPSADLPRLPDIEADRNSWEIVSWAVDPGDIIAFHPAVVHGGGPTVRGVRRRTLAIRVFGPDAVYAPLPWAGADESVPKVSPDLANLLAPGEHLKHRAFFKFVSSRRQ